MKLMTAGGGGGGNNHQAIAFVHENDIYYKPKVQQDLVCRITSTGNLFIKIGRVLMSFVEVG